MACKDDPGTTHYAGCDCHEAEWAERLAEAQAEIAQLKMEHAIWEKHSLVQLVKENEKFRAQLDELEFHNGKHECGIAKVTKERDRLKAENEALRYETSDAYWEKANTQSFAEIEKLKAELAAIDTKSLTFSPLRERFAKCEQERDQARLDAANDREEARRYRAALERVVSEFEDMQDTHSIEARWHQLAREALSGEKNYSKDWCQGFCQSCGTACAQYCEEIHRLKGGEE